MIGGPLVLTALCVIDRVPRKWEKPSDHAPVVLDLDQGA